MRILLIFILVFSGCSSINNKIFITKDLPKGKIGELYYAEIKMKKQGIIENLFYVDSNINQDVGVEVLPNQNSDHDFPHTLTIIKGVPVKSGIYNIDISGTARDGNKGFNKKYILEIEK